MIIQAYMKARPDMGERVVREVWRNLKEYLRHTAKKDKKTRIKIGSNISLFTDIFLKPKAEEYEAESLQYFMNDLYNMKQNRYDESYLMNSRYRDKNLEQIVEDVEDFFKNPPFKDKEKTK